MFPPAIQKMFITAVEHHQAGKLAEAAQLYQNLLAQQPDHSGAIHYLGVIYFQQGQNEIAADWIRRAIALHPAYPEAHNNLGNVLQKLGRPDEALAAWQQAIALKPDFAEPHNSIGNILKKKGLLIDAITAYRQAISLNPNLTEAHSNLGVALHDLGKLDDAITFYRQAITRNPNLPELHYNLSIALLTRGDFQEAWKEHEWRWKNKDFQSFQRNFPQPHWDGTPLNGRTLLLHDEQGAGDAFQFIRYLPMAAALGGKIIVECQPERYKVFQSLDSKFQLLTKGQPLPHFDVHCPLLSLPLAFKTTLTSIPANIPYLFPETQSLDSWRQKLAPFNNAPKIALNWAGNPGFREDHTRSITLSHLAPLAKITHANFFSIQKGIAAQQAHHPPAGMNLINLSPDLHDFADTAAVMSLMDLIITTDTAVAHLAGALGRPTWLMLQFVPDWRWMLHRQDSPWYPSMRLFRQPARGDWDTVIAQIAEALIDRSMKLA